MQIWRWRLNHLELKVNQFYINLLFLQFPFFVSKLTKWILETGDISAIVDCDTLDHNGITISRIISRLALSHSESRVLLEELKKLVPAIHIPTLYEIKELEKKISRFNFLTMAIDHIEIPRNDKNESMVKLNGKVEVSFSDVLKLASELLCDQNIYETCTWQYSEGDLGELNSSSWWKRQQEEVSGDILAFIFYSDATQLTMKDQKVNPVYMSLGILFKTCVCYL